jgi:hypothetical protein
MLQLRSTEKRLQTQQRAVNESVGRGYARGEGLEGSEAFNREADK